MELKKNSAGHDCIALFEMEIEGEREYYSRSIKIILEPERFNIFAYTAGERVKKAYGDFDLEEWIFVKREHGPALIKLCCDHEGVDPPKGDYSDFMVLDLLHNIYGGSDEAFNELKTLLKESKFPHEFQFYA